MVNANLTQSDIQALITQTAEQYGVAPALALAVAKTESNFNPSAVSGAGAIGIFQLMPATAAGLGVDPNDPQQNIQGGIKYLSQLLNQYGGDVSTALWAYNAGPGNVAQGNLPQETANYIPTVLANEAQFGGGDTSSSGDTLSVSQALDTSGSSSDQVSIAGVTVPTSYAVAGGIVLFGLIAWFLRD